MPKMWTGEYSFVGGVAKRKGTAFFILADDDCAKRKIPFALYLLWRDGKWFKAGTTDWLCSGISYAEGPLDTLIAPGEFGDVHVRGGGVDKKEKIGDKASAPKDRGPLRGVRRIDGATYVVGMDRQVYVRGGNGSWSAFDKGARPDKDSEEVVGFEAIDGYGSNDLYAVGWEGEIWHQAGKQWKQIDSPVNQVLVDVCCAGNGKVYACGREGLLLRGRDARWEVVTDLGFDDDFWSLAWFKGKLYIASMDDLYVFDGKRLQLLDTEDVEMETAYKLTATDGELWSIGAKDVVVYDGKKWTRIE